MCMFQMASNNPILSASEQLKADNLDLWPEKKTTPELDESLSDSDDSTDDHPRSGAAEGVPGPSAFTPPEDSVDVPPGKYCYFPWDFK